MFTLIGIAVVVMVIGFFIMEVGLELLIGMLKFFFGVTGICILVFAFKGCVGL